MPALVDGKPGTVIPPQGPIFKAVVVTTEVDKQGETTLYRGYIFQDKKRVPVVARPFAKQQPDTWFVMPY